MQINETIKLIAIGLAVHQSFYGAYGQNVLAHSELLETTNTRSGTIARQSATHANKTSVSQGRGDTTPGLFTGAELAPFFQIKT